MAKYEGSTFGTLRNKLGNAVASTWKGIPYVRTRVIPANPDTEAQQQQRGKFGTIVLYGRQLLSSVIATLWDPFARRMSGFNAFVRANLLAMTNETDFPNFKISSGSLELNPIIMATYAGTDVTINWTAETQAGGLPTDRVAAVVLDVQNVVSFVNLSGAPREDESVVVSVGPNRDPDALKAYLAFYRVNDALVVTQASGTSYRQVTD